MKCKKVSSKKKTFVIITNKKDQSLSMIQEQDTSHCICSSYPYHPGLSLHNTRTGILTIFIGIFHLQATTRNKPPNNRQFMISLSQQKHLCWARRRSWFENDTHCWKKQTRLSSQFSRVTSSYLSFCTVPSQSVGLLISYHCHSGLSGQDMLTKAKGEFQYVNLTTRSATTISHFSFSLHSNDITLTPQYHIVLQM